MPTTAELAAIKAFARLAIAAYAEPSRVRTALGPQAVRDITSARRKPLRQLIADAEIATAAIGLTVRLFEPSSDRNTREVLGNRSRCEQFADAMIECGAAIRDMNTARPAQRRYMQRQANRDVYAEFDLVNERADALKATIGNQVVQVRRFAFEHQRDPLAWAPQKQLFKACRRLRHTLDDHDAAVRQLHRLAEAFRWRALPGTIAAGQNRRTFMATVRAKRNMALAATAAIRTWVDQTAPGPL